jgi:hypothetical protein
MSEMAICQTVATIRCWLTAFLRIHKLLFHAEHGPRGRASFIARLYGLLAVLNGLSIQPPSDVHSFTMAKRRRDDEQVL